MDEPLSNLDAKLRVQMRADIAALQARLGVTTVYVTHDQAEAMTLGHRVAVLKDGRLQQCDAPRVLYERPANTFVAGLHRLAGDEPARRCRSGTNGAARSAASTSRFRSAARRRRTARASCSACGPRRSSSRRTGSTARVEVVEEIGADAYVFCVAEYRRRAGEARRAQRVAACARARGQGLALPARGRGACLRRGDRRPARPGDVAALPRLRRSRESRRRHAGRGRRSRPARIESRALAGALRPSSGSPTDRT